MSPLTVNLLSALAISGVIYCMAVVKNAHIKALIYSLPIPITIALIATGGKVGSSNVIGLILLSLFLWLVLLLYRNGLPILVADITAAVLYVVVGFTLIKGLSLSFATACIIYTLLWLLFVALYKNGADDKQSTTTKMNPVLKAVVVFGLAFVLLTSKTYLSGIVVTFPFSGVFAVIEGKNILRTLASVFSRNSLAILLFFIAFSLALKHASMWLALLLGWVVYAIALAAISKLIPYQK